MSSTVMGHDEETLFVLVEDTVSLQSFGSEEDRANINIHEGNCCLLDKPKECSDTIHDDGFVTAPSTSDGIEQHFIDEIVAAMEDDDEVNVVNEKYDNEWSTREAIIKEVAIHTEQKEGSNSAYLSPGVKFRTDLYEDDVSIKSYSSDVSNKSLVLVTMEELTPQLESRNESSNSGNEIHNGDDNTKSGVEKDKLRQDSGKARASDTVSIDEMDPSALEYDEEIWQLCTKTAVSPGFQDEPQKVLIRELSYEDELQDAEGIDLMAPVFLAITGEDETVSEHVNDMKRKTKSIEDLCSMSLPPTRTTLKKRSVSDLTLNRSMKPIDKIKDEMLEKIDDIDGRKISADGMNRSTEVWKSASTIKSYASFDDLCLSSTIYDREDTFEDPDAFIDHENDDEMEEYEINADIRYPPEEILDNISFSSCQSWKVLSDSELATRSDDGAATEPNKIVKRKDTNALKRSPPPPFNRSTECGFLEYPYTERRSPVGSPQKIRCLVSCNTSPSSLPVDPVANEERRIVVNIEGFQRIVDMKLIAPYLKVLSHGGHHQVGNDCRDIVVFTACFLPPKSLKNYAVIMEQLFYYCVHAVDLIVSDTYEIVFFNSAIESKNMPSRKWIKKYYALIFYKLRKNLKNIYFVHQSLWLKAALQFSKLFVSTKSKEKIHLIQNIEMLQQHIPLDYIFIPKSIYDIDKSFN